MHRLHGFPAVFAAGGVSLACAAATAVSPTQAASSSSVLFIGNSLTASNDLAARVAKVAAAAGRRLRTSAVTASGASLADHWADGRALRAIREVSASYRAAAEANDALLLPAGDAWTAARERDSALALTEADGFHPSVLGTWLAALAVECTLFPQDRPVLAKAAAGGLALDAGRRDLLVDAACGAGAAPGS